MSYTLTFRVMEDDSSIPLLSKEAAVDGDTALKIYSQILHETCETMSIAERIVPKTLAEMLPSLDGETSDCPSQIAGHECPDNCPGKLVPGTVQNNDTEGLLSQDSEFVCDSCNVAITAKQAEESYIISGKELCSSCFHQRCEAISLRKPEPSSVDDQPTPAEEQKGIVDSRGKVLRKWTPGEKGILSRFPTAAEAVEGYRKNFPNSDRSDLSISGAWYNLKEKKALFCQTNAPADPVESKPVETPVVENYESSEHPDSPAFRLGQYVRVTGNGMLCSGQTGRIMNIRGDEALIAIGKSRYWIAIADLVKPEENPSKN